MFPEDDSRDLSNEKQPEVKTVTAVLVITLDDGRTFRVSETMSADLLDSSRSKTCLLFASLRKRAIRAANAWGAQARRVLGG